MRLRKPVKQSTALEPDYDSGLARSLALDKTAELSQIRTLHDNSEALAWRIYLIEQAEHSIDAQYYSWHLDASGLMLIDKLITAADRGVRVRILLDDIHTFGSDRQIATLNSHKNIELRLFNPFTYRSRFKLIRLLELLFKLSRLNHRMHNKLLVVDNLVAIIGGRNIGDEYFDLSTSLSFLDLDLLITGACVTELSDSFDLYWCHRLSYTVHKLIALRPKTKDLTHLRRQIKKRLALKQSLFTQSRELIQAIYRHEPADTLLPITAKVDVLYDAPGFDLGTGKRTLEAVYRCSQQAQHKLVIMSAYFIPDDKLLETLRQLIAQGVQVKIYTNSLASIDVTVAFSGYQSYRQELLGMGAELYELDSYAPSDTVSQRYALHAKCMIYDSSRVYVGTLNLDPRSASLNTEIGLLINSQELASTISHHIQQQSGNYWRLERDKRNRILWSDGCRHLHHQPSRGAGQAFSNWCFSLLPIKRHL